MRYCRYFFSFLISVITATTLSAQDNYVIVQDIKIEGLKKTKKYIVERELDFISGDTLSLIALTNRLEENKKRILSTALFNIVNVNITNWDTESKTATIAFDVVEAWYLYPIPIFELADRNFNVWWNEQGRSLDRVDYGLRIDHINLTGRKDYLKVKVQQGYTPKYELKYIYPYLDKERKWGIETNIFYSTNKELSYRTIGNKPSFFSTDDERIVLRRFRVGGQVTRRAGIYAYQSLKLEYHHNRIDETVSKANPDYFLNGDQDLKFLLFEYKFRIDKRQFFKYPDNGYILELIAKKEGFGLLGNFNNMPITAKLAYYHSPSTKIILANITKAKTNITRAQVAFANNTALGYGEDYIRGYELYVHDGTDYAYNHTYISFKCIDKLINFKRFMALDQFKLLPLKVYFRLQMQLAYVNEPIYKQTNTQNNRLLIGYGPAIDVLMYNNFLFQFEYSFNHLKESGLYIHNSFAF